MSAKKSPSHRHSPPAKSKARPFSWRVLWIAGTILVLVLLMAILYLTPRSSDEVSSPTATPPPLPPVISVNKAYILYSQENAFLLDVRNPQEFAIYHTAPIGSNRPVNIPLEELSSRLDEIPPDRDIVVICTSGRRSEKARDLLTQAGFRRVTSVSGGIIAWVDNNLPVEGTYPR